MSAQYAEVRSVEQLSPSLIRIVLADGTLDDFEAPVATDVHINAQFVPAGAPVAVPFESADLDHLSTDQRPRPRRHDPSLERRGQTLSTSSTTATSVTPAPGPTGPSRVIVWVGGPGGLIGHRRRWHARRRRKRIGDRRLLILACAASPSCSSCGTRPRGRSAIGSVEIHGSTVVPPTTWPPRSLDAAPSLLRQLFPEVVDVFVHGEAAEVRAVRKHLLGRAASMRRPRPISPYRRRQHRRGLGAISQASRRTAPMPIDTPNGSMAAEPRFGENTKHEASAP